MKLMIDISEEAYDLAMAGDYSEIYGGANIAEAVVNGKPIPSEIEAEIEALIDQQVGEDDFVTTCAALAQDVNTIKEAMEPDLRKDPLVMVKQRKPRQRKIKVYGTNAMLRSPFVDVAHRLGLYEYSRQVHIICGATSLAEANHLCEEAGLGATVFRRNYTSVSSNKTEVTLAGNGGIFVCIGESCCPQNYYPLSALKEEQ